MTTDYIRAAARRALEPLIASSSFTHKATLLSKVFGRDVSDLIRQTEREAREFNKQADDMSGAMLTPDAAAYWLEVELLIKRGKAAQASGNQKDSAEVARCCERAVELFEELVPDHDKPKFKFYDPQRPDATWDERWSYIEFEPPLLHSNFDFSFRISSPKNHAQREVLATLLQPQADDELVEKMLALRRKLMGKVREERNTEIVDDIARMNREQERLKNAGRSEREKRKIRAERKARKDHLHAALAHHPKNDEEEQ